MTKFDCHVLLFIFVGAKSEMLEKLLYAQLR